jgi:pimeloyl-ACP methyl ester carboxylesterase
LADDDYPDGVQPDTLQWLRDNAATTWGDPVALQGFAPSMAGDRPFAEWWARLLRVGISRSGMQRLFDTWEGIDVRAALPAIKVPTRVICRSNDLMTPFVWSGYLARHIAGAELVDLGLGDHLFFTGDPSRSCASCTTS